jgi:hypothetical protein
VAVHRRHGEKGGNVEMRKVGFALKILVNVFLAVAAVWWIFDTASLFVSGIVMAAVAIGMVLGAVAIFWWFIRKAGSPDATEQTLKTEYSVFEKDGLPELDRLHKLFSQRGGWRNLPSDFLRELSSKLGSLENVVDFVVLSERHQLDTKLLPNIAELDSDVAIKMLPLSLISLANRLQENEKWGEVEKALALALCIGPEDCNVALRLAVHYHGQDSFSKAIPLFERGLPEFRHDVETMGELDQISEDAGLTSMQQLEEFGTVQDIEGLVGVYEELYEDCLRRVSAEGVAALHGEGG